MLTQLLPLLLIDVHTNTVATVDNILDSKAVPYDCVLEVCVSTCHDLGATTTKVMQITSEANSSGRYIEMYLHRKFYHMLDVLTSHLLRMTCCRLVAATEFKGHTNMLRLLPTEHIIVLLNSAQEHKLKETMKFLALWPAVRDVSHPQYQGNVYSKVVEIGQEEVVNSQDGSVYRRVVTHLEYDGDSYIALVLWDTYVGFAKLFEQGDTLFIERPYAKPSLDGRFCLEYGPGTIFYVAPFKPQEEIFSSQTTQGLITVNKTDMGKLDFLSYPDRLTVADIVPNIINAVMLLRVSPLKMCTVSTSQKRVLARDHTGDIGLVFLGLSDRVLKDLQSSQWLLVAGLNTEGDKHNMSLLCNLEKEGRFFNVEAMCGWQSLQYPC